MRIIGSNLRSGDCFVTRRYGRVRLFKVRKASVGEGWSWRVFARWWPTDAQGARLASMLEVKFSDDTGGRIWFLGVYGVRMWRWLDFLMGKPRLYAFTKQREASHHAYEYMNV